MARLLYLDTARLGQMSPAAQSAHQDFARFAGEVGASIQFDDFLWHGSEACTPVVAERYAGLTQWKGIASLKQSLSKLTTLPMKSQVLLAGRLAQLMKLGALLLCRQCRNILVTDVGWPPYHRLLEIECRHAYGRTTAVNLSKAVFEGHVDEDQVVELVRKAFIENGCDGLFLTAVSHLGIRLPVQKIAQEIKKFVEVRFAVVDGAQDFCHAGCDLSGDCADLYLAGAHKWLGGYYPLGVAFYGKLRSRSMVETVLGDSIDAWQIDDPLLHFVGGLNEPTRRTHDETVNLAGLFSCQGAICDTTFDGNRRAASFTQRLENADRVAELASSAGWIAQRPHSSLQSGILLLKSQREHICALPADCLRAAFHRSGVALTSFDRGQVRLSMPAAPLQSEELQLIDESLRQVA